MSEQTKHLFFLALVITAVSALAEQHRELEPQQAQQGILSASPPKKQLTVIHLALFWPLFSPVLSLMWPLFGPVLALKWRLFSPVLALMWPLFSPWSSMGLCRD